MPKIFEYLGIIIMFYSNEHEPIHVHGKYQGIESKKELKEFKNFVEKFKNDIVQKWIDYFVYHKSVECIKIEGKVK